LDVEQAREVPTKNEDLEKKLAEASSLRVYTNEELDTCWKLMGEITETSEKMDAN
jgi:hypothetical protein